MIGVGIIGVLTATAIPQVTRYQARSKTSERRTMIQAIFKGEEAVRQGESGRYVALGAIPASATAGSGKITWRDSDYRAAATIDWMVEGATYGQYAVAIDPAGTAQSICGWTDVDGDGVYGGDVLWQPSFDQNGSVTGSGSTPAAPCDPRTDVSAHSLRFTFGTDAPGQVTAVSRADAL